MAAWKRSGGLEPFEERLKSGMRRNGYTRGIRRRDLPADPGLRRIRLSRNRMRRASRCWSTSRPGSSATTRLRSAPRCSTASRWASMRPRSWCRTRAATASRCGRRTCSASDWDCTLEGGALRLGLRMVSGLVREGGPAHRRRAGRTSRVAELEARPQGSALRWPPRARCNRWPATAARRTGPPPAPRAARRSTRRRRSALPALPRPREGEEIVADYASLGLTLGRHPLALAAGSAWTSCSC